MDGFGVGLVCKKSEGPVGLFNQRLTAEGVGPVDSGERERGESLLNSTLVPTQSTNASTTEMSW